LESLPAKGASATLAAPFMREHNYAEPRADLPGWFTTTHPTIVVIATTCDCHPDNVIGERVRFAGYVPRHE